MASVSPSSAYPADGAVTVGRSATIQITWTYSGPGAGGIRYVGIAWRLNGGPIQKTEWSVGAGAEPATKTLSRALSLASGDKVAWWSLCTYTDGAGGYGQGWYGSLSAPKRFSVAVDSTPPDISSVSPPDGASIAPSGTTGITFSATVADVYGLDRVELWVDGAEVAAARRDASGSDVYAYSVGAQITKAGSPHSWYLRAIDVNGNIATTAVRSLTVLNAAPDGGHGTLSPMSGTFGNQASVTVSWADLWVDYNAEDNLSYELSDSYDGGSTWTVRATGITGTSTIWVPTQAAADARIRVRAYDGTVWSGYSVSNAITITSTQPPNTPVLGAVGPIWREGETQTISWTPASPPDPDADPVTYEAEFSAAGDFADAVPIFSGQTGSSYAWTIPLTLVSADTPTCKVRLRARDPYDMVSTWATSGAFTLRQNAAPGLSLVEPADGSTVTDTTPTFTYAVADADGDPIHMQVQVSPSSDYSVGTITADSMLSQDSWEHAVSPFASWSPLPAGGAASGERMRWTLYEALRYDLYYVRARVYDGIVWSDWVESTVQITPSADTPVVATIDGVVWPTEGLLITDATGGETSTITFRIPTMLYHGAVNPPTVGDTISVAVNINGIGRSWNGSVVEITVQGAHTQVSAVQDDVYLSRRVCASMTPLAVMDVGAALASLVSTWGAPLAGTSIDTTTGVTAAITPGYKLLREHLDDWARALGYIYWVDATGTVHFIDPADLLPPIYTLTEVEDG